MKVDLRRLAEAAAHDPAKPLWDAAGDLSDYEIFHNLVLVATYIAPPKVLKGPNGEEIILHQTDKSHDEDRFQGKTGLVLRFGPLAFKDDSVAKFGGVKISAGEWVIYRPSDGTEMFIRDRTKSNEGIAVRIIEDTFVRGRVKDPSLIY